MDRNKAKKLYKENKDSLHFEKNIICYRAENENIIILSIGKTPFDDDVFVKNKKTKEIYFT